MTRSSLAALNSHSSGARSAAAARGSFEPGDGCGSLATSSDCTTIRAGAPTASTSHWIAATARCVSDTSRTDRTRTSWPAGERQCASRVSVPARMSSTRSWESSSP